MKKYLLSTLLLMSVCIQAQNIKVSKTDKLQKTKLCTRLTKRFPQKHSLVLKQGKTLRYVLVVKMA